jgi:MFS family permease
MGFPGSTVAVGGMLGPVNGGFLVGTLGWRSIFLVNVPIGIIAAAMATKVLKIDEILSDHLRMDYAGATLWIVSIGSLVLMFGVLGETGALAP